MRSSTGTSSSSRSRKSREQEIPAKRGKEEREGKNTAERKQKKKRRLQAINKSGQQSDIFSPDLMLSATNKIIAADGYSCRN